MDCCRFRRHHPKLIGLPGDRKHIPPMHGLGVRRADSPVICSFGSASDRCETLISRRISKRQPTVADRPEVAVVTAPGDVRSNASTSRSASIWRTPIDAQQSVISPEGPQVLKRAPDVAEIAVWTFSHILLASRSTAALPFQPLARCHTAAAGGYCRANNLRQRYSRDNKGSRRSCVSDNVALCGP